MGIHPRFSLAFLAVALLAGCASNPDRDNYYDDREKAPRLMDEDRARREGYEQGYWDAQDDDRRVVQQQRPAIRRPALPSGQPFGTAPLAVPRVLR